MTLSNNEIRYQIQENVNLQSMNTMAIGESCKQFCRVSSTTELINLLKQESPSIDQLLVLGEGSNLILKSTYQGLVIKNEIKGVEVLAEDENLVTLRVGGGESWHDFVLETIKQGWFGLENLSLIPGTVGACPVQNIGAYGVEVESFIKEVEFVDLEAASLEVKNKQECEFSYRESVFKNKLRNKTFISHVIFTLKKNFDPVLTYGPLSALEAKQGLTALEVSQKVCEIRQSKLPNPDELPNAGSFFKNPIVDSITHAELKNQFPNLVSYPAGEGFKLAAGWLIDQAGWKGKREGLVGVHKDQALVLVNYGGNGAEVLGLADKIKRSISKTYGVNLEIEPRIY